MAASTLCRSGAGRRLGLVATCAVLVIASGCAAVRPPWRHRADLLAAREMTRQAAGCMQRQEWEQAEAHLERAIEACPADDEARRYYAQVLWQQGQLQEAVSQMEHAVRLASAVDPLLLVQLGRMYLELDDPVAAEIRADQALKLDNQLPAAWSLKGDIYCAAGDTPQALRAYQQALSLAPDDHECRMAMARLYLAAGRPLRAVNTLSQLEGQQANLRDPGEYWQLYGTGLLALGQADQAAEALAQSLQLRRPSASLLGALVQAYGESGQLEQAERTAELARQILPPHEWPQFSSILPSPGGTLPPVASRPR